MDTRIALAALLAIAWTGPAAAHKPSFSDGQYAGPDSAYEIDDIEISIVVYHTVTCEAEQLWMTYLAAAGDALYVQLGIPVIDRLASYRPTVAVLAPGLPAPPGDLPFAVPDGLGVQLLPSAGIEDPEVFYEPFSQTESWILFEETLVLPEDGQGYIVAWDPGRWTGKLWVAVGTVEDFGPDDFEQMAEWLEQTQRYHETGDFEPDEPVEERSCEEAEPAGDADDDEAEAAAGCSCRAGGAGMPPPGVAVALVLGWLASARGARRRP